MGKEKQFALLGVAGYIAPRHLRAIKETGNELVTAYDPFDSVGILDSYFPECQFFTDWAKFSQFMHDRWNSGAPLDYMSICTPNNRHSSHVKYAVGVRSHAICEKPLALSSDELTRMIEWEKITDRHVYTVLQLRLHDAVIALRDKILKAGKGITYDIDLTYITSRGDWYYTSWKGDPQKSGGIAFNIGVHFFDMLIWIFGKRVKSTVHIKNESTVAGYLELERARVRYFLSIDEKMLPAEAIENGKRTYRALEISGEKFEFSEGFTDLHTLSYSKILAGEGFRATSVKDTIGLVEKITRQKPVGLEGEYHPYCLKVQ